MSAGPDPTDGFTSVAELDEAVTDGRISFDRYWTVRTALEDLAAADQEEHAYDPAPITKTLPGLDRFAAPEGTTGVTAPGFVSPPPSTPRPSEPPRSPRAMIPPPPAAHGRSTGPVALPITGPSADAAPTRADDRRRRRRRRPR